MEPIEITTPGDELIKHTQEEPGDGFALGKEGQKTFYNY